MSNQLSTDFHQKLTVEKNLLAQRAGEQQARWGEFMVTDDPEVRNRILHTILENARNKGEVQKVYKCSETGSTAEEAAWDMLSAYNKSDPPDMKEE